MPVLATVRHTGSHFALAVLEKHYVRHYLQEDLHGDPVWFGHAEAANMGLIREKCREYGPLILTMRSPMDVARSWVRRGRDLDHEFRSMWRNLFLLKSGIDDSFWFPVDIRTDTYLDRISERLGVRLVTDWKPKGVTGNNYDRNGGMTFDEAGEFFAGFPFGEFYGDYC